MSSALEKPNMGLKDHDLSRSLVRNRPSTPEIKCKKPRVTVLGSAGLGIPGAPATAWAPPGRLEPDLGTGETTEELTDGQQVWGPPETAGDFPSLLPHHWADLRLPRAPAAAPTSPQLRAGLHKAPWRRLPGPSRSPAAPGKTAAERGGKGQPGQEARPSLTFPAAQASLGSVFPDLRTFQTADPELPEVSP